MIENLRKIEFEKPELSVEDLAIALHQANRKLTDTNKRLIESERKRYELLSNISHDLRSPISSLRGYVEYLLTFQNLDQEEVHKTLEQMHHRLLSLDYLLNEMLLYTRLESAETPIRLKPVQIGPYLKAFFQACRADLRYSQRRLTDRVPDPFPYYALLDAEMFDRALDNLFTNALKFSSQNDEIMLDAAIRNKRILISVKDTGIGIDKKHLSLIFERTYMVSDSRTPQHLKGCGLGLSIVSSIMKKHNGTVHCESTPGKGSAFYLSLPLYNHEHS